MPTWSGTRKKLEEDYLCPALRGRVRYFAATYRESHDREGRAAILVDGEEILKSNYFEYDGTFWHTYYHSEEKDACAVEQSVLDKGLFDQRVFYAAFQEFDNQSIEASLSSKNPIVRIFALLDRRLGKQRLAALEDKMERELDWVRAFYRLRMEAEGLRLGGEPSMNRVPNEACASICGLFCGACPSFSEECHGCLSDFVRAGCKNCADHGFLDCAVSHHVTRCYECGEFPCEKLKEFSTKPVINGICNHASVIPDSLRMKKVGVSRWIGEKIIEHTCPKCGRLINWFEMGTHACG